MGFLSFRKAIPVSYDEVTKAVASGLKISILVPTRGRPKSMFRLVQSIHLTSSVMPEVVFYVDNDDAESAEEARLLQKDFPIKLIVGPRITLSNCWNECYKAATGDIIMQAGDDLVFKTPGWDTQVINEFSSHPDKLIFLHGDDGAWGDRFGTHGFLHRNWFNAVGYVLPPYFSSDFADKWLNDVANAIGRRVYLNFVTEHLHPLFGKAEWDKTHQERLARHCADNVEKLYEDLAPKRDEDVNKLRKAIGIPLISVMIPSRGRPEGLKNSIKSLLATATGNVEIIVRLDSDDPHTDLPPGITLMTGPRHGYRYLHRYYNEMAQCAKGQWLMLWNDDAVMTEKGWDREIGQQPEEMSVLNISGAFNIFPVVHRSLYEVLGHISLQAHSDTWLQSIARETGIEKHVPLEFRHSGAKSEEQYRETRPEFFSKEFQDLLIKDGDKVRRAQCDEVLTCG